MTISSMEERGRVLIPKEMREGMKPGQKILIEKREGEIIIKPAADVKAFSSKLRGCVKSSKIDPMDVKKIWNM